MLIISAIVFCLALYFSITMLTIIAAKIVKGAGASTTIDLLPVLVPSFLWALFYLLANWS